LLIVIPFRGLATDAKRRARVPEVTAGRWLTGRDAGAFPVLLETGPMLTYALFIASDPDPISSTDWTHLDQVFDRARLSSGGTVAYVRATEGEGREAEDFDQEIATFVNGLRLEQRDDGPAAFSYLADGELIGSAQLADGRWLLTRAASDGTPAEETAFVPESGHTRADAQAHLGKIVEDWLS
jgi:hypothetical protein